MTIKQNMGKPGILLITTILLLIEIETPFYNIYNSLVFNNYDNHRPQYRQQSSQTVVLACLPVIWQTPLRCN